MTAPTYSGPAAAEIAGITYRQLDYWARTDLVRPSVSAARGSGSRRRYSQRDLFVLKTIKRLLDVGIRLEVVRDLIGLLNDAPVDADIRLELAPGCTLVIETERADLADLDALLRAAVR
jgi:DNA-binding transcriptional MerR regulator